MTFWKEPQRTQKNTSNKSSNQNLVKTSMNTQLFRIIFVEKSEKINNVNLFFGLRLDTAATSYYFSTTPVLDEHNAAI